MVLTTTVNIMTIYDLDKLTMLWTTGPSFKNTCSCFKEEGIRNKHWQNKRHIWNHRRTDKEEL